MFQHHLPHHLHLHHPPSQLHHPSSLRSIYYSTHHLPSHPSSPQSHPSSCLTFQHLSQRLITWNDLHSSRTGTEYLFQNYYPESLISPEMIWSPIHLISNYLDHQLLGRSFPTTPTKKKFKIQIQNQKTWIHLPSSFTPSCFESPIQIHDLPLSSNANVKPLCLISTSRPASLFHSHPTHPSLQTQTKPQARPLISHSPV